MEPFIGQIMTVGFNFPPRGWALCEGQLLAINQNQALFSLLGTTFGGDGRTTFALPDLRGRSVVGVGTGAGISTISWGERGGIENAQLTVNNLPSHNHVVSIGVNNTAGEESNASGQIISNHTGAFNEDPVSGQNLGGVSCGLTGGGQSFNVRNPFLGMYVCIALTGLFPSRN